MSEDGSGSPIAGFIRKYEERIKDSSEEKVDPALRWKRERSGDSPRNL